MSEYVAATWANIHPGDYVRVTRKYYGRREGRLGAFHQAENGDWWWDDEAGNVLLDPWWTTGTVEKRI